MKPHANVAAAHSTAAILAIKSARERNNPRGTNGARTRDSITRNSAINTTATDSIPTDCLDVQPASLPLMTAYTVSTNEAVTVTAPKTSKRPLRGGLPATARGAGISQRHNT